MPLVACQGSTFMTISSDGHSLFTSVTWDLAHEQLVLGDADGIVQVWNTYTGSVSTLHYSVLGGTNNYVCNKLVLLEL